MKKFTAILLCVALLILSGCTAVPPKKNGKVIAVSFYPVYIFTLNLLNGIEGVEVKCMAEQSVGCLHDYSVTAKDAKLVSDCEAFVINGAGMESFVEDLYSTVENLRVIDSSEGIELLCSHHHHEEESDGHSHNHAENSHIWMSVNNAMKQVENISKGLTDVFPQYKAEIKENETLYLKRLGELKAEIQSTKAQVQGQSVVSFHDAYAYLAEDLGFYVSATVESDDGGEPSAKKLAQLSDEILENNIKSLFIEPQYEGNAANILVNETGAEIYVLNPVINGEKSLTAYEDVMRQNIQTILKAVK